MFEKLTHLHIDKPINLKGTLTEARISSCYETNFANFVNSISYEVLTSFVDKMLNLDELPS